MHTPDGAIRIGPARAVGWSALLALVVFAGSLGNGFAYDDEPIIENNPVVTEARWADAAFGPYWQVEEGYGLLYRPVALLAYAAEWQIGGGRPVLFHLVNLVLHAAVSVLLALLVLRLARIRPQSALLARRADLAALVAGGIFAVHPVHVEAVANGVGQGELWAAFGVLGAIHLYIGSPGRIWQRSLRLVGIGGCYALALGAKEIAVTLPALLLLVDSVGRGWVPATARVRRERLVFLLLLVVFVTYLALRWMALGSLVGEETAMALDGASTTTRVATALSVVPVVVTLLLFPLRLAADYDPGVLELAHPTDPAVLMGGSLLLGAAVIILAFWRRAPLVGYGVAWTLIVWSVVSNLFFTTGVLLAERTLYLPSVGVAMALGVGAAALAEWKGTRPALVVVALAVVLLSARTVTRVPVWFSTFTVMEDLARTTPDSWRSDRARAAGLLRIGEHEEAFAWFDSALAKAPRKYDLLTEYGAALKEARRLEPARELLERAIRLSPRRRAAWQLLAELHLIAGRMREAHRVAMEGVRFSGNDAELWRIASEAYLGAGFLPAAVRARRMALLLEPGDAANEARLEEILAVMGEAGESG
ncbi:MAG: tetratricopeptide repeat protein [Longimicrobiales bacterium]|nr:tetratricopeptide repeat protein [Longimicrobiales bacterium]